MKHPVSLLSLPQSELLSIIRFIRESRASENLAFGIGQEDPYLNAILFLMERSLQNKVVTVTSLANATNVPYTSARRRVAELFEQGLIQYMRPDSTGKSVKIEPTDLMVARFEGLANDTKRRFSSILGQEEPKKDDFYFGGAYLRARFIPPPTRRPDIGADLSELRMLFKRQPSMNSINRMRSQFETMTSCQLKIELLELSELRQKIIENSAHHESQYDVIAVTYLWLRELSARGILKPINDEVDELFRDAHDFYPAAWGMCRDKGVQYGIPIEPVAEVLCYRKDLCTDIRPEQFEKISSFLRIARELHKPHKEQYGVAFCAARGQPLGQSFLNFLSDFGQPLLNCPLSGPHFDGDALVGEAYRPMLCTEAARQTLGYLQELCNLAPPEILTMDWDGRMEAYRSGRVGTSFNWSSRLYELQCDPNNMIYRQTAIVPHPNGARRPPTSPLGGFFLAVPSNLPPERQKAVLRAIHWLTSPEVAKHVSINGASASPRISVSRDPEVWRSNIAIGTVDHLARSDRLIGWANPQVPEYNELSEIIGHGVHAVLAGEISPGDCLAQLQNEADQLMQGRGYY